MKRLNKFLSLAISLLTITTSVSAVSASAYGPQIKKPTVVSISGKNINYSEILEDNTILSFYNSIIDNDTNKNKMRITYYADDYAEFYNYSFSTFSVIFKLNEKSSIDDFSLDYDNIEFSYKEVGNNVYQISAENADAFRFGFEYEKACEIENIIASNPIVEDTDIVWGYEHKNSTSPLPTTSLTLKDGVSLTKDDFAFLEKSGFALTDESEDLTSFEILKDGEHIYNWNARTPAMREILQNIDGINTINNDFVNEARVRIDGYSMLEGYSITGIYDYSLNINGDVNLDGSVNISDVVAIASYVGNPEENFLGENCVLNGDIHNTGDGLTANDALMIQQYLAGIITEL